MLQSLFSDQDIACPFQTVAAGASPSFTAEAGKEALLRRPTTAGTLEALSPQTLSRHSLFG